MNNSIKAPQSDLFKILESISKPIPDSAYDNGLNVRCKECQCWVSKRIFPKVLEDGLCPDCREEKETKRIVGKSF